MTDFAGTVDSGKPASSLDRVLDVQSPNRPDEEKPPHLQAPKYVHHFDTWSIVKDLEKGGFSQEQTVTIMKAVRGLLGDSMGLARKALVSKSNEENEMYLFKAACSELKTEIQNNRKAEAEILRTQRSQLQHEVDILGQNMTQDLASLKDELKGLFDDRKMIVRVGQKQIESKVRELLCSNFQAY
jgi:tRNA uridine 5-carbamoylmethylation protein Kti12